MTSAGKAASVFFVSIVFLVAGCSGQGPDKSYAAQGELKEYQRFTLKNLDGDDVDLKDVLLRNKAVLINFWATWCPPCREEIPGLISLQKKFGNKSFTILGIDVGESQKKVSAFAEKMGINYPVLLDDTQAVAESYRVVGIPTSLLITSDGKIIGTYHAYTPRLVKDVEAVLELE